MQLRRYNWDTITEKLDTAMGARRVIKVIPVTFPDIFDDCIPLNYFSRGNIIIVLYRVKRGRKIYSMQFGKDEVFLPFA
jgi:hypothetical protein